MHINAERLKAVEEITDDWLKAKEIEPENVPGVPPIFLWQGLGKRGVG